MKFLIDKKLIEKVKDKTDINYRTEDCYDEDNKVWLNLEDLEEILDDLLEKIDDIEYEYLEYKEYQERDRNDDFIPEREVPEIHGKGISW